jgi:hypothetical protein
MSIGCFQGVLPEKQKGVAREPFNRAGASLGIRLNYWFGVARRVEVAIPCRGGAAIYSGLYSARISEIQTAETELGDDVLQIAHSLA